MGIFLNTHGVINNQVEVETQRFQLLPYYNFYNETDYRTLIGYSVSNINQVQMSDLDTLGELLDLAVDVRNLATISCWSVDQLLVINNHSRGLANTNNQIKRVVVFPFKIDEKWIPPNKKEKA